MEKSSLVLFGYGFSRRISFVIKMLDNTSNISLETFRDWPGSCKISITIREVNI